MPNFTGICGKIVLFIAGFIVASTSTFGAGSLCLWHNEVAATLWPLQLRSAQLNCALCAQSIDHRAFGAGSLCLWHNEVAATLWPLQLRRAQLNCALSCAVDTEFVFAIFGEIIAEIDFAILQYFAEFFT